MSRSRFRRLTEYLHLNDNTTRGPVGSPEYDWLHKIRPLIEMTRRNFQRYMMPGQCQSIDEGMIRYKGHYFAKQYTPCKPIKRGMKVWMRCEPNGYTNDYKIYLGKHDEMQGQSLGERVVKHLSKPLKWKGHHLFFDRYFTSIPLLQNLEVNGIYGCGTINTNRKGFPHELKNPTFSGRGDTEQLQHDNLVATAWKDAKPVHIVSTTSDPLGDGPTHRRVPGGEVILIQRPPAVAAYQENYYGVDRAMQYRSKCPIGRQSRKYWKYFMNFILEVALVNTFLLWKMTPGVVKPRKHYSLGDLHVDVAMSLIEDFSNRKQPRHLGKQLITAAGLSEHHSMKLERPRGRCKWCAKEGKRKDVVYGCDKCMVHLCQGACFQAYHVQNQLPVL